MPWNCVAGAAFLGRGCNMHAEERTEVQAVVKDGGLEVQKAQVRQQDQVFHENAMPTLTVQRVVVPNWG